ncbi:unnamed protein product [Fraxinus pennsylvanica]|uniref:Uncharacterized protein n=1 Tax=Fraxinus pennsylvanica TaxID=56036 RepID=A0AAD2DQD9_9LAMI|nr:unnamed protein product [Fraxinus pennsylvanica]
MGSKWRKVKLALGLNMCLYTPRNNIVDNDDEDESLPPSSYRHSDAALLSPVANWTSAQPTPGSNRLKFSKSLSRSSSKCLQNHCHTLQMKELRRIHNDEEKLVKIMRSLESLPKDLKAAIEDGRISGSIC